MWEGAAHALACLPLLLLLLLLHAACTPRSQARARPRRRMMRHFVIPVRRHHKAGCQLLTY